MALRNLYDQANKQYVFPTIDASVLEINNVPISTGGAGTQNLQQVLSTGSNGGNQSITNLNSISLNGSLQISNSSSSALQLNLGSNSFQLVNSQNQFSIQNYISGSLYKEVFRIDNQGNLLLGDSTSSTPYAYVFGSNGVSRIYDTLYNPPPSVTANALSTINKSWALGSLNVGLTVINTPPAYSNPVMNIYGNFNPTINFPNCNHIKVNISSCIMNTNTTNGVSVQLKFLLITNKTNISTITAADVAKNSVFQLIETTITSGQINVGSAGGGDNINCEVYDSSGINSLNLICLTDNPDAYYNLNSLSFSVSADTGLYSYLPSQTTF
jgi:hypothetical protein